MDFKTLPALRRWKSPGSVVSRFSSLRVRLILLVLLAIIPALGIILYDALDLRQREVDKAKAEALTLSRLAARQYEELIEAARQTLLSLSQLPEVRSSDPAACSLHLASLLEEYEGYNNFMVADEAGNMFCSTTPLIRQVNLASRTWFQRTIQTRDFTVSDYQLSWVDNTPIVVFSYPILDAAGQIQGIVSASLEVTHLNQIAAETDLSNGTALMIIDRNGAIVVHHPQPEIWVGQALPDAPLVMAIKATSEGKVEVNGPDDVTRLYAFTLLRSSADTGLYLAIGIPKQVAFAEADRIWTRNLIFLGVVGLLALTAAWVGSDLFVLRQVNALIKATHRLRGDLSARTGLAHEAGELGQLARAFDDMAATLERHEADRQRARGELIALNASLEQRVAQRTALVQLLQDIAVAANEATSVEAAMKFALDRVCAYTGWPIGHVYLATGAASDKLVPTNILHLAPSERFETFRQITETARFASNVGLPGRVFMTCKPAWIQDVTKDSNFSRVKSARDIGVKASFAFPVLIGKDVAAVLEFFSKEVAEPDESLLEVMAHMGTQLGRVIERKQMEAELAEVQRRLMESREAERLHLAQELHDGPLQDLHGIAFRLNELERILPDETSLSQMAATHALLQQVIQTLRIICGELRPPALAPFGLEKAIRSHIEHFQKTHPDLKIHLDLMQDGQLLPEQIRLTLFRIYQQALNNVQRHAAASQVTIRFGLDLEQVLLEIEDNGRGFQMPQRRIELARQGHLGLVGAAERAEAVGGQLRIKTTPGGGTLIQALVPHLREQEMFQGAEQPIFYSIEAN